MVTSMAAGVLFAATLASSLAWAQTGTGAEQQSHLESVLASSLILTDSETVTFGVLAFDLDSLVPLSGDEYGSQGSIKRRQSIRTYALPARWQLSADDARLQTHIKTRISYLRFEEDVIANDFENPTSIRNKNYVYGGYLAHDWSYAIDDRWKVRVGTGIHLLEYRSRQQSNDMPVQIPGTGVFAGSDARALVGELKTRLVYANKEADLPWEFQSTYSYYRGRTISGEQMARPETWSWSNGIVFYWQLSPLWETPNRLRLLARRIELGGDTTDTFNTHNYYEFGVGWLFEVGDSVSWLDNVGLSVSANVGSSLSGGSLVLLYNEQY